MSDRAANVANAYWANFAKTGDPNGFGLPHWPGYDLKEDHLLLFRADGVAVGGAGPLKARLDLTAAAADQKDP